MEQKETDLEKVAKKKERMYYDRVHGVVAMLYIILLVFDQGYKNIIPFGWNVVGCLYVVIVVAFMFPSDEDDDTDENLTDPYP